MKDMNEGMNIMNRLNEWFSISDVSEKVAIPPETVRRYVRHYREYLKIRRGERNAYLVHASSLNTIKKIRHLMEQGNQHEQVKSILEKIEEGKVQSNSEEMNEQKVNELQLNKTMLNEIRLLAEQNKELLETLNSMHERMNGYEALFLQLQVSFNERIHEQDKGQRDNERKRDEYLMKAMNELQGRREGNVSTKEKKKIFTNLFKSTGK